MSQFSLQLATQWRCIASCKEDFLVWHPMFATSLATKNCVPSCRESRTSFYFSQCYATSCSVWYFSVIQTNIYLYQITKYLTYGTKTLQGQLEHKNNIDRKNAKFGSGFIHVPGNSTLLTEEIEVDIPPQALWIYQYQDRIPKEYEVMESKGLVINHQGGRGGGEVWSKKFKKMWSLATMSMK